MAMFKKYCAGVYVMKSAEVFNHGDETVVDTKWGGHAVVQVWKKLGTYPDGEFAYSVTRDDGKCAKERLLAKAAKREEWAASAERKSDAYYEKSNEHRDFLSLAEPIKVGHHSEKRHRKIIDQSWNNMGKSVAMHDKAQDHASKAEGLKAVAEKNIFIDTPDCLPQLAAQIATVEEYIAAAKAAKAERFTITNAQANLRRYKKRLETAKKLWELPENG